MTTCAALSRAKKNPRQGRGFKCRCLGGWSSTRSTRNDSANGGAYSPFCQAPVIQWARCRKFFLATPDCQSDFNASLDRWRCRLWNPKINA